MLTASSPIVYFIELTFVRYALILISTLFPLEAESIVSTVRGTHSETCTCRTSSVPLFGTNLGFFCCQTIRDHTVKTLAYNSSEIITAQNKK